MKYDKKIRFSLLKQKMPQIILSSTDDQIFIPCQTKMLIAYEIKK